MPGIEYELKKYQSLHIQTSKTVKERLLSANVTSGRTSDAIARIDGK